MGIASYAPSTALEAGKNIIVEFFTSGCKVAGFSAY